MKADDKHKDFLTHMKYVIKLGTVRNIDWLRCSYAFKLTSLDLYVIPLLLNSCTIPGGRRPTTDTA